MKRGPTITAVVFFVLGVILLVLSWQASIRAVPAVYRNQGKLTFETEQEYADFKRAIGRDGVIIDSVDTLSSSPPVVVIFSVRRDADVLFPYGIESVAEYSNRDYFDFLAFLGVSGILVSVCLLPWVFGPTFVLD